MTEDPRVGPPRMSAESSLAYQRFAQANPHPHLTNWRVQQELPVGDGRFEIWVDIDVAPQSPFGYPNVLAVFTADRRLIAVIAAETMPLVHNEVYLGLFGDGQHTNLGADRALLDANAFFARAAALGTAVLDRHAGVAVPPAPAVPPIAGQGLGPDISLIGRAVSDRPVVVNTAGGEYELRELIAVGGFGSVYAAIAPGGGHVVAKVAHERGGSASGTRGEVYPTEGIGFDTGSAHHHSFSGAEMVEVYRVEAELLLANFGNELPQLLAQGMYDGRPVLLMQRLDDSPDAGRWDPRTAAADDFVALLTTLDELATSIGYHGDLKPEHIFHDMDNETFMFVDPAYRGDPHHGTVTYEFNPLRLTGPAADVFAVAVMLFMRHAQRLPERGLPLQPAEALSLRPTVPSGDAAWVDRLLQSVRAADLPDWAHTHAGALAALSAARRASPTTPKSAVPARTPGSVSVAVADGWFFKESVTLIAPDGQANLIASSEPVAVNTTEYATSQGEVLRREFSSYDELSFAPWRFASGEQGYLREFEWTPPDGHRVRQMQVYVVGAGRGYTATATVPSDMVNQWREPLLEALRTVAVGLGAHKGRTQS